MLCHACSKLFADSTTRLCTLVRLLTCASPGSRRDGCFEQRLHRHMPKNGTILLLLGCAQSIHFVGLHPARTGFALPPIVLLFTVKTAPLRIWSHPSLCTCTTHAIITNLNLSREVLCLLKAVRSMSLAPPAMCNPARSALARTSRRISQARLTLSMSASQDLLTKPSAVAMSTQKS